jgi:hypothetical protein
MAAMGKFDYSAPAELYSARGHGRRAPLSYRRFATAAEAIRFAVEQIPKNLAAAAYIETGEQTITHKELRELYDSPDYPLERKPEAPVLENGAPEPAPGRAGGKFNR